MDDLLHPTLLVATCRMVVVEAIVIVSLVGTEGEVTVIAVVLRDKDMVREEAVIGEDVGREAGARKEVDMTEDPDTRRGSCCCYCSSCSDMTTMAFSTLLQTLLTSS